MQKAVLKNFAIFTGKQLFWSLLFNKVPNLQACNFIKMRLQHRWFPVSIVKFFINSDFKEQLLLLNFRKVFSKNLFGTNVLHPYHSD